MELAQTSCQERISKPLVEHIVDVSVLRVFDEVVDSVDVPEVVEEVVEEA